MTNNVCPTDVCLTDILLLNELHRSFLYLLFTLISSFPSTFPDCVFWRFPTNVAVSRRETAYSCSIFLVLSIFSALHFSHQTHPKRDFPRAPFSFRLLIRLSDCKFVGTFCHLPARVRLHVHLLTPTQANTAACADSPLILSVWP